MNFDKVFKSASNDPNLQEAMRELSHLILDAINPNLDLTLTLKYAEKRIRKAMNKESVELTYEQKDNIMTLLADIRLVIEDLKSEMDQDLKEMLEALT